MPYAIISLGGKQYRVQEGERLLVDRVPTEEGKTFHPDVLMLGGDGTFELAPKAQVTVRVVGSALGDKVTIVGVRARIASSVLVTPGLEANAAIAATPTSAVTTWNGR